MTDHDKLIEELELRQCIVKNLKANLMGAEVALIKAQEALDKFNKDNQSQV